MPTYIKTTWVDGENKYSITDELGNVISGFEDIKLLYTGITGTPISALNLNHIEQGIEDLSDYVAATDPVITGLAVDLAKTNLKIDAHTGATKNALTQMVIDILNDPNDLDTTDSTANITSCFDPALKALRTGTINLTAVGTGALSGGAYSGSTAAGAFLPIAALGVWQSSQLGAAVDGVAWIGYDFGSPRLIDHIVWQCLTADQYVTSVKFQKSDDGSTWTDVQTFALDYAYLSLYNLTVTSPVEARYFRLLANSQTYSSTWSVRGLEFRHITPTALTAIWQPDTALTEPVSAWITADKAATGALTFYISRDGGVTFTEVTLDELEDITSQPSGSSVVIKVVLDGTTGIAQLNAIAWGWR